MPGPAPPQPPRTPIVGHTLRWARNPLTIGSWVYDHVGGVAHLDLLNTDLILVTAPDPIQEVLVEKRELFPKSDQYTVAFGEGLGSVSGDQWHTQRDVISEFFTPDRVTSYADTIVSLTATHMNRWADGEQRLLFDELKVITLDILFETIFDHSIEPHGRDAQIRDAVDNLDAWFKPTSWVLPPWIPTPARRRFTRASTHIDAIAEDLLQTAEPTDDSLLGMLQNLTEHGDAALTHTEITSQLRTFLFAGHETTASTLAFALYLLSTHPDVAATFHTEVESVLDGALPTLADVDALEVTESIIRETLRLYPPAFRLPRVTATSTEIGGYTIPAGIDVLIYTVTPHRNAQFWEAPFEFHPHRWTQLRPDATGFEYLPFGGGPRRCIGEQFALLELQLVLATLGQQYTFEPLSDLEIAAWVAARPKGGLPVRVTRR